MSRIHAKEASITFTFHNNRIDGGEIVWVGLCQGCGALHLRNLRMTAFHPAYVCFQQIVKLEGQVQGEWKPSTTGEEERLRTKTSQGQVCQALVHELPEQEALLASYRVGGMDAVRELARRLSTSDTA